MQLRLLQVGRNRKEMMGRWKEIVWTKPEIETLREVWPRESRRVILERLPNRSWSSCASKASYDYDWLNYQHIVLQDEYNKLDGSFKLVLALYPFINRFFNSYRN